MKKVLIISSVASMIQQFNRLNIDILEELGYEITIATNFESPGNISKKAAKDLENELIVRNIKCIQLDFKRGIGSLKSNFSIFVKLRKFDSSLKNYIDKTKSFILKILISIF